MKPTPLPTPLITFLQKNVLDVDAVIEHCFNLFPDHYPVIISENTDQLVVGLEWSTDAQWYIDPNVAQAALELYKIPLVDVVPFFQIEQCYGINFVFSMFHSRAIIAAPLVAKQYSDRSFDYIIHVDDHTDLMPALLHFNKDEQVLYDSVFNQIIDMSDPGSVVAAIDRGIINKGNFLTSYLLVNNPATLVHVSENLRHKEYWLEAISSDFSLAGMHFNSIVFVFSEEAKLASSRLIQTPILPERLLLKEYEIIWLDIDMDAFCNRYNGDSDQSFKSITPLERKETTQRIESFLYDLSNVSWLSQVKAVSIAVSPGFFPTDYWGRAIPKVYNEVKRIICQSQVDS